MRFSKLMPLALTCIISMAPLSATQVARKEHPHTRPMIPAKPATIEDLKKTAAAFEAADKAYMAVPEAQNAEKHKTAFKTAVLNSTLSSQKLQEIVNDAIYKATLNRRLVEMAAGNKTTNFQFAMARHEVLRKLSYYLEKGEKGVAVEKKTVHNHLRHKHDKAVSQAAAEYFDSMIELLSTALDKYMDKGRAHMACREAIKSLLKQGNSSESLKNEMEKAGIKNSYLLKKTEKLAS